MTETVNSNRCDNRIAAKVVVQFQSIFTQMNPGSNREKPQQCWESRNDFLQAFHLSPDPKLSFNSRFQKRRAVRLHSVRALICRERRNNDWKNVLHEFLREEFMGLRSLRVKSNHCFSRDVAVALVRKPSVPCTQTEIESENCRSLFDGLSMRCVYDFCARFNIKVRMRTGKNSLSLPKTLSNNTKLA